MPHATIPILELCKVHSAMFCVFVSIATLRVASAHAPNSDRYPVTPDP